MSLRTPSTRPAARPVVRIGAVTAAAGLLTVGLAASASAHVSISASETGAGAYTVLTVSVPHGCDGSPTTKIAISVPEGINAVTPTRNPFYTVSKKMEKLDPSIEDSHGNEVTERVSVVTYTATTPLPDGQRDTMELSLQLPDAVGETLAMPVIQTCEKGETAWTEVAAEGEDPESLESPAPLITITEASSEEGHDDGESAESEEGTAAEGASVTSTDTIEPVSATSTTDDSGNGLAIAGLVAGVLGLVAGGAALARSRKA